MLLFHDAGIGFGACSAVDFALVMDVLPDEPHKAKDLAVWHQVCTKNTLKAHFVITGSQALPVNLLNFLS